MTETQKSAATPNEIRYTSADTPLFAFEQGQGHPMVMLHGGMADHRAIFFRFGALATSRRLIAPDLRGFGRSVYAGEFSWDRWADDVAALMDHLGVERAVVGGTSAGSAVALRFALRYPARAAALLLVWPVYPGEDLGLSPAQTLAMERMHEAGKRALAEGIEALLPMYAALPPPVREIAVAMARGFQPASVAAATRFLASGAQPLSRLADLRALLLPTLVVPGIDPEHPADVASRYAAELPAAVLSEKAADPLPIVTDFLGRIERNAFAPDALTPLISGG